MHILAHYKESLPAHYADFAAPEPDTVPILPAYIIGIFADVVSNRRSDTNQFERKMRSVFGFLDHIDCPKDLREQVKIFYSSRYPRKTLFDEEEIYNELPSKFAQRLVLHRFERTIKHVPFFRNACAEVTMSC